jgi:hypothetical protein
MKAGKRFPVKLLTVNYKKHITTLYKYIKVLMLKLVVPAFTIVLW